MTAFVAYAIAFVCALVWIVFFCVKLEFEKYEKVRVCWRVGISLESVFAIVAAVGCFATLS